MDVDRVRVVVDRMIQIMVGVQMVREDLGIMLVSLHINKGMNYTVK